MVHNLAPQAEAVAAGSLVLPEGVACCQGELAGLAAVSGGWQGQGSTRRLLLLLLLLLLLRAETVGDILLQGGLCSQH
jgi:hypothetical protein